jgi:hypothetical protein
MRDNFLTMWDKNCEEQKVKETVVKISAQSEHFLVLVIKGKKCIFYSLVLQRVYSVHYTHRIKNKNNW